MDFLSGLRMLVNANSMTELSVFFLTLAVGLVIIWICKKYISALIHKLFSKTWPNLDDFINSIENLILYLLLIITVYLAFTQFYLTAGLERFFEILFLALTIILILLILQRTGYFFITGYFKKRSQDTKQEKLMSLVWPVFKVFLWIFAFLFFLDNIDVQISGLIAGLGVGGIAIGFASQSIIADIFSYFTIFIDKPFEVGDFIIVGEFRGIVEHIGIKTTRLKSLSGEQLVFSNADITSSRIQNYQRMKRRRINFKFGVTYQTSVDQLNEIREIISGTIAEIERAELDRAHFHEFGEHSLIFEVIYFVNSGDYADYMDIQQQINLTLKTKLSEIGAEFAFPTRTLYVKDDKESFGGFDDDQQSV